MKLIKLLCAVSLIAEFYLICTKYDEINAFFNRSGWFIGFIIYVIGILIVNIVVCAILFPEVKK
jgi:hypothetical protein